MSTVSKLIERLQVIDENIFAEATIMPLLFVDMARYRVAKMRERSQAEAELDAFDAEYSMTLRVKLRDTKTTEGYYKTRLRKQTKHKKLVARVEESKAREEFAKLLLEAGRMRSSAVKILAEARVYEGNPTTMKIDRQNALRRLSKEGRKLESRRVRIGE